MAKKINIEFTAQPVTTGAGFLYTIQVDGFDIFYQNGSNECKIDFIPNGATPANFYELTIGTTLDETLQIALSFLRENYINDLISYTLNDNIIVALVEADAVVSIDSDINDSLTITTENVEPFGENLIYYLYFDDYTLNIYKNNYQGNATQIYGSFAIKKASVDSILEPIRGTGLQLYLEANQNINYDEFSLDKEFTYKTELLKGTQTVFKGYIKPDGIQQNYVYNEWLVNIESVDGLGVLKDLSFVQQNGLRYTGKISVYDVIKGCLDRTRLSMNINTSVDIEYVGYIGTNILKDIYVNTDRFIKDSNDTVIMDCNEVLTSMLNLFSAIITQQDGEWWICRPNDLQYNGYTTFINQTTNTTFVKNLNAVLGSQIDNFYPHHCENNQQIEVKGAISAYRLNYEYGFIDGFLLNPNLNHDTDMNFDNWTTNPSLPTANIEIIPDAISLTGLKLLVREGAPATTILTSTPITADKDAVLTFRTKVSTVGNSILSIKTQFIFKIYTNDGYYLNGNNEWVMTDSFIRVKTRTTGTTENILSYELTMPPVPNDCTITVKICEVRLNVASSQITAGVNYVQILDNERQKQGIVGEFHTVSRLLPPSSITKENQKVYNGDGEAILIGSIYKEDLETLTSFWTRKNKFENLPLLGISAMDDLRIQANAIRVFSGSIYGQIPYLSVVEINGLIGQFMFIEYDYDYKTNISQGKLLQFYNDDLADIQYTISPNYGNNTIKPTIKS